MRVTLRLTTQPNAVVVPNQAIQTGQNGSFVYVVHPDRTVAMQPVTLGSTQRDFVVVNNGVQARDEVVTDGQLRLSPGAKVEIKNAGSGSAGMSGAGRSGAGTSGAESNGAGSGGGGRTP